jgi:hypothetical protein
MSQANLLWSAPRIYGEPLKLGIAVAQSSQKNPVLDPRWPGICLGPADRLPRLGEPS